MAYGHAERTLAAIQRLEAETVQLLDTQDHLDPEQEQWLRETARPADPTHPVIRCRAVGLPRAGADTASGSVVAVTGESRLRAA